MQAVFQSTPPVKAATVSLFDARMPAIISIHAAREGGDLAFLYLGFHFVCISIHAAREGGDA